MNKDYQDNNISQTLNVIKKAIEEDTNNNLDNEEIIVLTKKVKEDGTIVNIENLHDQDNNDKKNIDNIIDKKINEWLNKNMPNAINKYFSKK